MDRPEWMRGTYTLTEEQLAEFDRRATERMNADDDFTHRLFAKPELKPCVCVGKPPEFQCSLAPAPCGGY